MWAARDIARVAFGWAPAEVDDTSWLNGVRGAAAFLVMMSHFTLSWLSDFADAPFYATVLSSRNADGIWYFKEGTRLWAPWRLPIFRVLLVAGGGQVAVFFVISGFVLTWSPLGAAQGGHLEKLYRSLGSSTIRRWIRLYVPCAVVTFAYCIRRDLVEGLSFAGTIESFWMYLVYFERWANPFKTLKQVELTNIYGYNVVMWTIPYEFQGSIFVYVLLLGVGRVRSFPRRMGIIVMVALYAMFSHVWGLWLFGSGMALADYTRNMGLFKKQPGPRTTKVWSACFISSFLMLSFMPESSWFSRPGFDWTIYIPLPPGWREQVGEERFFWGWGAIFLIASSCHLPQARSFFELPFLQHLGKISFMLYLVHYLILHVISSPLRRALYAILCRYEFDEGWNEEVYRSGLIRNTLIFFILLAVSTPIVLIVSNFLTEFVDRPITSFAKRLDDKLVNGFGWEFSQVYQRQPLHDIEMEEADQLLGSRQLEDDEDIYSLKHDHENGILEPEMLLEGSPQSKSQYETEDDEELLQSPGDLESGQLPPHK